MGLSHTVELGIWYQSILANGQQLQDHVLEGLIRLQVFGRCRFPGDIMQVSAQSYRVSVTSVEAFVQGMLQCRNCDSFQNLYAFFGPPIVHGKGSKKSAYS